MVDFVIHRKDLKKIISILEFLNHKWKIKKILRRLELFIPKKIDLSLKD